jgi:hypothetical protein
MSFGGGNDKTKLESFFDSNETPSLLGQFGKEGMKGNTVTQKATQTSGIKLAPESDLERLASGQISGNFGDLIKMLSGGPGQGDVDASNASQQDFVKMMRGINASGGLPTDEDRRQANIFADDIFRPQTEALNQSFTQQNEGAARLAAKLNRPINDPIIQAKLRQEQMRQSSMLGAERASFTSQEARNSPFRRLSLQGQLADAQGSLASQAMSNRMQLLNLGNSLQSQERNFRIQTGERFTNGTQTQHSGGGLMGGLGAMTGAFGSVMGAVGQGMSLGTMGGGGNIQKSQATPSFVPMQTGTAYGQGGFMSDSGLNSQLLGTGNQNRSTTYDAYTNSRKSRFGLGQGGGSMFGGSVNNTFGTSF